MPCARLSNLYLTLDDPHCSIAVQKPYRQHGVGLSLMQAAHAQMTQCDMCDSVSLRCRITNEAALRMYTGSALGYHITLLEREYYSDNKEDSYYLEKSFKEKSVVIPWFRD